MGSTVSRGLPASIFGLTLLALIASAVPSRVFAEQAVGHLRVTVMVVGADLSLKPVPKRLFHIACVGDGCTFSTDVATSFTGGFEQDLPPGSYSLTSAAPLEFEGRRLSWSVPFSVTENATTTLELSNDNAAIEAVEAKPAASPAATEGELFRRVKSSVFKVISESGHGSGFLIDSGGLVLTNHHVVADSEYLAVKIDAKRKYPAKLVAMDAKNDIAVVRVNPEAVADLTPLPITEDTPDRPSVSVGERVLAVGSPLATETILTAGLVSKIEEGAIYSDVAINPGNSGGPLFNMLGEVIGVNTFGLIARGGQGVSGIVRIHLARPAIESARAHLSEPPPEARRLPEPSDYRFPPDKLRERALQSGYAPMLYHVEAGKVDVQFITPVVIAKLQTEAEVEAQQSRKRRSKAGSREYSAGSDFYEWRRYAGDYRPVVTIQAIPEIGMTGGSVFAVFMLGANAPQNYRFKTDFERMELVRDGVVVEPIFPGRVAQVVNESAGVVSMKDIGYFGMYEYPPEAFRPGAELVLKVWEQGKPEPKVRKLKPELVGRIWSDFEPYFQALEEEVSR